MAYTYHDDGFITLAPYLPRAMNATIGYTSGSTSATYYNMRAGEKVVGRYVYIGGSWKKITAVNYSTNTITLNSAPSSTSIVKTMIVTMNEITITGTSLSFSKLELDYSPMIV